MKQIVLASTNQGKVREVAMMVQDMGIEIVPLSETAFQGEIEETGTTFEENAIIKAMQVAKTLGIPALAGQWISLHISKTAFSTVTEDGERVYDGKKAQIFIGFGQPDERTAELLGVNSLSFEV